jgi:hypothetical protein
MEWVCDVGYRRGGWCCCSCRWWWDASRGSCAFVLTVHPTHWKPIEISNNGYRKCELWWNYVTNFEDAGGEWILFPRNSSSRAPLIAGLIIPRLLVWVHCEWLKVLSFDEVSIVRIPIMKWFYLFPKTERHDARSRCCDVPSVKLSPCLET